MWSGLEKLNAGSYSPNQKRMHPHVVLNTFWNAPSFSPFQFFECTLMQSLPIFGMHPYLVLTDLWSATSCGPDRDQECSLIQSPPILDSVPFTLNSIQPNYHQNLRQNHRTNHTKLSQKTIQNPTNLTKMNQNNGTTLMQMEILKSQIVNHIHQIASWT